MGFGKGFGNVGIRGYAGVGLKDSHHNLFTTAKAGVELSIGGLGLNVSGSVPFGKTRQVAKNGHTDVVLVDPSGQQCDPTGACVPVPPSCSNPLPGQVRHCEIGVAVTDPSYEKALRGFEVGLDYQVQVGGVWLRPSLGYYRYGNGLMSGAKAGFEVSVPLTSQLSLNIGAGGQKAFDKGDGKGLSGFGSLGISYHFGSVPVSQLSALEHRFAEAPTRNQRTLTTHTKEGNTTLYRNTNNPGQGIVGLTPMVGAIWNMNSRFHFVSEVWIVDATAADQLDDVVAVAAEDAIVLVDGSKGVVKLDNVVTLNHAGVGIVGGGSALDVYSTIDGGKTFLAETVTMPGSKPIITQVDTRDIFYANRVENPILYGMNIEGGKNGVEFINSNKSRIIQVNGEGAINNGFSFVKSDDALLYDVSTLGSGQKGFYFEDSKRATVVKVSSFADKRDGFYFLRSDDALLSNVFSSADNYAFSFEQSQNAQLYQVIVTSSAVGMVFNKSDNVFLSGIHIDSTGSGINFEQSNNATLVQIEMLNMLHYGMNFNGSNNVKVGQVKIELGSNGDGYGVGLYDSFNIQLDDLSIVGNLDVSTYISTGILLRGSGKLGEEISFHNVSVNNATNGYILQNINPLVPSVVKDLGGNAAMSVTKICDGNPDVTGIILVNGTERCQ